MQPVLSGGRQRPQGCFVADDQDRALGLYNLTLLQVGEETGHRFPRGPDHLRDFFMSQQELEARLLLMGLAVFRTAIHEKLRELFGGGMRQAERADFMAGYVVFLAELFGDPETGLAVAL